MNFSFRYTLIIFIICLLVFLGIRDISQNEESIPLSQKILSLFNPFWQSPEKTHFLSEFSERFSLIDGGFTNNSANPVVITGKTQIFDEKKNPILSVWLTNASLYSSGNVVDYVEIEQNNFTINPGENIDITVLWQGIADKWLENDIPVVRFSSPLSDTEIPRGVAIYEKIISQTRPYTYFLTSEITLTDLMTGKSENIVFGNERVTVIEKKYILSINTAFIIYVGLFLIVLLFASRILSEKNFEKYEKMRREKILEEFSETWEKILEDIKNKKKNSKKN